MDALQAWGHPSTAQNGESSRAGEGPSRQAIWATPQILLNGQPIQPWETTRSPYSESFAIYANQTPVQSGESSESAQRPDLGKGKLRAVDGLEPGSQHFPQRSLPLLPLLPFLPSIDGMLSGIAMPAAHPSLSASFAASPTARGNQTSNPYLPLREAAATRQRGTLREPPPVPATTVARNPAITGVADVPSPVANPAGTTRGQSFPLLSQAAPSVAAHAFPSVPSTIVGGSGPASWFPSVPTTELGSEYGLRYPLPTLAESEEGYPDAEEIKAGKGKMAEFA